MSPLRSVAIVLAAGLGVCLSGCAQQVSQPHTPEAAVLPANGDETYEELCRVYSDYDALFKAISKQHSSLDGKTQLFVDFASAANANDEYWPADFAPRAAFIELCDFALKEAERAGLHDRLAKIASSPRAQFPELPEFDEKQNDLFRNHHKMRWMFRYQASAALARGDGDAAVKALSTYLAVSRLFCEYGSSLGQMNSPWVAQAAQLAMTAIASSKISPKQRAKLADAAQPLTLDPIARAAYGCRSMQDSFAHTRKSMPDALFSTKQRAEEAWQKLDDQSRLSFQCYAPVPYDRKVELPLPEVDVARAEWRTAFDLAAADGKLSPVELMRRFRSRERSTASGAELRIDYAYSFLTLPRVSDAHAVGAVDALRAMLAIEAYHDDHGEYPLSLHELVPKYLAEIPPDPAKPGEQLRYLRREVNANGRTYPYALYSRGADGEDNQGTFDNTELRGFRLCEGTQNTDVVYNAIR